MRRRQPQHGGAPTLHTLRAAPCPRPTDYLIEQTKGAEMLQPEMNACTLYLGGDVGKDTLHLLHGMPGLEVGGRLRCL